MGIMKAQLPTVMKKSDISRIVRDEVVRQNRENSVAISARVLWVLHNRFGFGAARLKRFFDEFNKSLDELDKYYEMYDVDDESWLCVEKLKDIGVDIRQWVRESK